MKPGHTRPQCKASITPVPEQTQGGGAIGQNNGGNTVCRLAKCMFGSNNDTHNEERSRYIGEKCIADSGAFFHMTHSANLLSDVRLGDDK